MKPKTLFIILLLSVFPSLTQAGDEPSLYFITPQDGDVVSGEFTIKFGLRGMGVAPSGFQMPDTGHHHLLIDIEALPPMDASLPKTDQVRHFGGGQTETSLTLPTGTHTLQLLLGDYAHIPHDPPVISKKITVTVQ
jgi:hypothetical protein